MLGEGEGSDGPSAAAVEFIGCGKLANKCNGRDIGYKEDTKGFCAQTIGCVTTPRNWD